MLRSLHSRLLLVAGGVLVGALGLTGIILDLAFQESAQIAVKKQLQTFTKMLIGVANFDDELRLIMPDTLTESRFATARSGLYAVIQDEDGQILWRSPSLLGRGELLPIPVNTLGQPLFNTDQQLDNEKLFTLDMTVYWDVPPNIDRYYTFRVAESKDSFQEQVHRFRNSLWVWLFIATIIVLIAQTLILRWSLRPLRQVTAEITAINTGQQSELQGHYPRELQALTDHLNALIRQSQTRVIRYRHALDDLAHSLKTPLAVLRSALETTQPDASLNSLAEIVHAQTERMRQTVEYQLQRAQTSGRIALKAPVSIDETVLKLFDTFDKVYRDKALRFRKRIETDDFYGEAGDLMEILGNLMDNACKWARRQVTVRAHLDNTDKSATWLILQVEDDGPGIAPEQVPHILERGGRMDPTVAGHGIGLATVRDIVEEAYQGRLHIGRGEILGGALVQAFLPHQSARG